MMKTDNQLGFYMLRGFPNPKLIISLVAIVVRLATVAATFNGNAAVASWEDVSIAKNLMEGNGYSIDNTWRSRMLYYFVEEDIQNPLATGHRATASKPPLFPFLLVLLFAIFGFGNFLSLFVLNSLLAGATAFLLFSALQRYSRFIASTSALAFAVYPPFVFHSATTPESTTFVLFLISLFLYQSAMLVDSPTIASFFRLGLIGGLMVMTNAVLFPFVLSAIVVLTLAFAQRAQFLRCALVSFLAVTLFVAPWMIRNYVLFHVPVMPVRSVLGHTLLKARHTSGDGLWIPSAKILEIEKQGRTMSEVQEDELLTAPVVAAIKREPLQFAKEMGKMCIGLFELEVEFDTTP